MSSLNLIKCIIRIEKFENAKNIDQKNFFVGCNTEISIPILEEFLKRFFSPIFIILIGLSSSLVVLSSKHEKFYKFKNILIFCLGIILIMISEITLRYSGLSISNMLTYFFIPILLFTLIYMYIYFTVHSLRGKKIAG